MSNPLVSFRSSFFITGTARFNDLHILCTDTNTWRLQPTFFPPCPRSSHSSVFAAGQLFVMGGYGVRWLDDMHVLDVNRWEWSLIDTSASLYSLPPGENLTSTVRVTSIS